MRGTPHCSSAADCDPEDRTGEKSLPGSSYIYIRINDATGLPPYHIEKDVWVTIVANQ